MKYTLVEDSHCRLFLKEVDYGFIGEVHCTVPRSTQKPLMRITPLNKGVDMTQEQLEAALKEAGE